MKQSKIVLTLKRNLRLMLLLTAVAPIAFSQESTTVTDQADNAHIRVIVNNSRRVAPTITDVPAPAEKKTMNTVAEIPHRKEKSSTSGLLAMRDGNSRAFQVLDSLVSNEGNKTPSYVIDDVYGGVTGDRVNAYAGVHVPDSFYIDLRGYVPPLESVVTSSYGYRHWRMHYGIDLRLKVGTPIKSAFDGTIRISSYNRGGYGHYVVVRHTNGLETVYGHLSRRNVKKGDVVKAGDVIGLGGNTGRSTGPHLHFEARFLGIPINPAHLFDYTNHVAHRDGYMFHNKQAKKPVVHGTTVVRIRKGDTLGAIAVRYGTSVRSICRLNGISSSKTLRVGAQLRVR